MPVYHLVDHVLVQLWASLIPGEYNVVIIQLNNWEKSYTFINFTDTLHRTTGRLESDTSNESATPTVFCTSLQPQIIFYNGQRNGWFVWLMLQDADDVG
jgi:hypothetical protein